MNFPNQCPSMLLELLICPAYLNPICTSPNYHFHPYIKSNMKHRILQFPNGQLLLVIHVLCFYVLDRCYSITSICICICIRIHTNMCVWVCVCGGGVVGVGGGWGCGGGCVWWCRCVWGGGGGGMRARARMYISIFMYTYMYIYTC